jgi:hypothetical protein
MLPSYCISIAIGLRLLASVSYVTALVKGRVKPSLVSWFFWGLTAMIAFVAQLYQHVGAQAWAAFAVGIGPVIVFILALIKGRYDKQFSSTDIWCGVLTCIGIVLWLLTKQPLMALVMALAADFVSGIPTIIKCYRRPHTEQALPYCLSVASMVVTLATLHEWRFATWAFPVYILLTNLNFATLILTNAGVRIRRLRNKYAWRISQEGEY